MTDDERPTWATRLRDEREARLWTQKDLAVRLRDAADNQTRARLPSLASIIRRIVGYEAGHHQPGGIYAELYCRAFEMTKTELFDSEHELTPQVTLPWGISPDDHQRLILAARNPARVDGPLVDSLLVTLASQRRIEDLIGSRAVLEPASANLGLTLRLLKEARGPLADRLSATASEASQFAGWLHTATGDHDGAGPLYDQALRLGLQAGDDDLVATALSMRGHLAWAAGDIGAMAGLSRAAAEMATATGTRTMATQQGGRALAILGDRQGALRAAGRAEEILDGARARDDPDSLYFYGHELLTMQRGLILAYLADAPAQYGEAAEIIVAGIEALPPPVRDSEWVAWYRVQAAAARARAGDVEQAVAMLHVVLAIVSATGGGGRATVADIARTHRTLTERWPDHADVLHLAEALR